MSDNEVKSKIDQVYPGLLYLFYSYLHQDWDYEVKNCSVVEALKKAVVDEDDGKLVLTSNDGSRMIFMAQPLQNLHSELYDIVHRHTPKEQLEIFNALKVGGYYVDSPQEAELFFHSLLCLTENHLRKLNLPIPQNPKLHTEREKKK